MATKEIIAHIIGIFGTAMLFWSFQAKTTARICFFQSIGCLFFTMQFVLLQAWSGAALNALSLVRNVIYAQNDKKWTRSLFWPFAFSIATVVISAFTWGDMFSLLPTMALVISSFALRLKNTQLSRLVNFPSSPMWLVYDIHHKAYAGIVNEVLLMSSILIGLWRYRKNEKSA